MKEKPLGIVTHVYGNLGVAIVKSSGSLKTGMRVKFKGHTTDFEQDLASMQYDHKEIAAAKKGQEVGIKVDEKVRVGDAMFAAE